MKFIVGTKQNMTQIWDDDGRMIPATVILATPITVTGLKTIEKDGYSATMVGYGKRKIKRTSKALRGHFGDLCDDKTVFAGQKEFRLLELGDLKRGDSISVDKFAPGDVVAVSGVSKGKGFQGVVKRHGFGGGRRSHGQKHSEREPGSIGAGGIQRVFKGMRMGGRMGGDRVTIKNLKVLKVDKESNQIMVSGAVPGRRGTLVEVRSVVGMKKNKS